MEISLNYPPPTGLVKCWELIESDNDERVGGVDAEKSYRRSEVIGRK